MNQHESQKRVISQVLLRDLSIGKISLKGLGELNSSMKTLKQVEAIDLVCEGMYQDLEITEAEFQGKKVKLNDPIRGGAKKFYVYVKDLSLIHI